MQKEGPNDGLVSVASSRCTFPLILVRLSSEITNIYSGGTYLGTLDGVNHLELVGWVNQARNTITEWMGGEANFRPATFYLGVANTLAEIVEGQQRTSTIVLDPGAALVKEPETIQGMPAEQSLPRKGASPKAPAKQLSVDSRGRTIED